MKAFKVSQDAAIQMVHDKILCILCFFLSFLTRYFLGALWFHQGTTLHNHDLTNIDQRIVW